MSKRHVRLLMGLAWGLSMIYPILAAGQPITATQGEVETRGDALAPGVFLEEDTRAVLPPGVSLRRVYDKGIGVTKLSEGWRSRLYNDAAMYCTIGYGHLVKKSPCDGTERPDFLAGITEPRSEDLLREDMEKAQIGTLTLVDAKLTDGQYAAVVDFVFNVGRGNFQRSTLRQVINDGPDRYDEIPYQFRRWVQAGGKTWPGLERRRDREIDLFFDGIGEPRVPAPVGADLTEVDIRTGEGQSSRN